MNLLKTYLSRIREIKRSAADVKEMSYDTLETPFNETGRPLKPKARCVINFANKGAGIPDGGLFPPDQFQKRSPLNLDEITEATNRIRRIAKLILMEPELNENYQWVNAATYDMRRLSDAG